MYTIYYISFAVDAVGNCSVQHVVHYIELCIKDSAGGGVVLPHGL